MFQSERPPSTSSGTAGGRAAQCCPRCHLCLAHHGPGLTVLGAQSTASHLLGHVLGSLTQKRRVKTVAECRRAARARFSWRGGCRSVWDGGRWASVTLAVGICFSLATSERRCSPAHMLSGRQRCFLGHLRASEGTVGPQVPDGLGVSSWGRGRARGDVCSRLPDQSTVPTLAAGRPGCTPSARFVPPSP